MRDYGCADPEALEHVVRVTRPVVSADVAPAAWRSAVDGRNLDLIQAAFSARLHGLSCAYVTEDHSVWLRSAADVSSMAADLARSGILIPQFLAAGYAIAVFSASVEEAETMAYVIDANIRRDPDSALRLSLARVLSVWRAGDDATALSLIDRVVALRGSPLAPPDWNVVPLHAFPPLLRAAVASDLEAVGSSVAELDATKRATLDTFLCGVRGGASLPMSPSHLVDLPAMAVLRTLRERGHAVPVGAFCDCRMPSLNQVAAVGSSVRH